MSTFLNPEQEAKLKTPLQIGQRFVVVSFCAEFGSASICKRVLTLE